MAGGQIKRRNSGLPRMEAVARIGSIPIVESSLKTAETVYTRIKRSNTLFNWYFNTAEATLWAAVDSIKPAARIVEGPLNKIDNLMCKSLDIVEQRVPIVYLPPQVAYYNTKEYMSDHLVRPVIRRANSVKEFGHSVMDSKVSNYAADKIDGAIERADKYVERFLPEQSGQDEVDLDNNKNAEDDSKEIHVIQTIHRGQRFSRKLKRRLTKRTILEARALKKQSVEAIHILVYAAELMVTDPKMALQRAQELWAYLSENEPENQARPETLEQLLVMITRETARRIVHFINFTVTTVNKLPKTAKSKTTEMIHNFIYITNSVIHMAHLDKVKVRVVKGANGVYQRVYSVYDAIQRYATNALERLAIFLSGRLEAEKITSSPRRRLPAGTNNNQMHNNINGVY
uniref:Putative lipid storage droplets surface-binding protein 1 n=1 Tax=Nyssomyia neivai TaxID=330878 RepID=A0A1L8DZ84_9DIPT